MNWLFVNLLGNTILRDSYFTKTKIKRNETQYQSVHIYPFLPFFPESGSVSRHLGHKLRDHEKENKGALQAIFFKKTLYLYYKRENYLF